MHPSNLGAPEVFWVLRMEFLGQFCPARTSSLHKIKFGKKRIPGHLRPLLDFNIKLILPIFFSTCRPSQTLQKTRERLTSETGKKAFYLNVGLPGKNGYFQ